MRRQKRKVRDKAVKAELVAAKAAKYEAVSKALTQQKREESRDANRRVKIYPTNQEPFSQQNKSTAMVSEGTGILDTVKKWGKGSEAKLLDVVLSLIGRHKLQDKVAAEIGTATESTAGYIVKRARAALQELKQCKSEAQRQEYRLALTILAPEERARMNSATAAALGVVRQKKPFLDAMQKRAAMDRAIKANEDPLKVGDYVDCQHGKGVVTELHSDHDSESDAVAHPCAVEFEIGGEKFTSRFARSGKGKSGARLRPPAISFSHGSRASRKDSAAHLEQKVYTAGCWLGS